MSATTPKRTSKRHQPSRLPSGSLLPFEVIETDIEEPPFGDGVARAQNVEVADAVFGLTKSIAEVLENLIAATKTSIDAALHRINSRRLARTLLDAHHRGVRIRLLTDRSKYEKSAATRDLISGCGFPVRDTHGRDGEGSKMHHKFVVLDDRMVVTGSYNWTFASEERNHENVLILRDAKLIETFNLEFEALWEIADEVQRPGKKT